MLCIPSQCSPEHLSCPPCHPADPSDMTLTLPHLMGIPSWHQCPSKVAPTLGGEPHFTWWVALAETGNLPKCLLPQPCTLARSQKCGWSSQAVTGGQPHPPVYLQGSSCGPNVTESPHSLRGGMHRWSPQGAFYRRPTLSSLGDIDDIHDI